MAPAPRTITPKLIRDALASIPPDVDRDAWARLGMAIKSEIPGAAGFDSVERVECTRRDLRRAQRPRDTWRSIKAGGATSASCLVPGLPHHPATNPGAWSNATTWAQG